MIIQRLYVQQHDIEAQQLRGIHSISDVVTVPMARQNNQLHNMEAWQGVKSNLSSRDGSGGLSMTEDL